jgi:ABC-type sugar transport system substrate-binding protein
MYMNELLGAYPNLKAIWTNDGYDNAIFGIVEQYSDPTKYPKLKCGAYKDGFWIWKDRLVDYPKFECVSVSNPPGIAYDAVYAAHYLVSGEEIDGSALGGEFGNAFIVDFPVITNDNIIAELEKIQYEKSDHVVDLLMTSDEIKDKWFK